MRFRRKFTREFKLDAVQRLRAGEPAGLVVRSLEAVSYTHLTLPTIYSV